MQRIPVAAESADVASLIGEHALELGKLAAVLQHGQFAVSVARIISRGEFDRGYV
jgi:hypothetical protein